MTLCWYHSILTVYGSWLSGDPRGFRTRHHREHIDGDYKNPPTPGKYATYLNFSLQALKQSPVVFDKDLRSVVGVALRDRLQAKGALVVCIAVARQHIHILAKMLQGQERDWLGAAKRHAWFVLREQGWRTKLWAKGSQSVLIRDRPHQLNAYRYIMRHAEQGAWVWSIEQ
jgi:hypothetical protein